MSDKTDLNKDDLLKEIIFSIVGILILVFAVSFFGFKIFSGSFKHDKINTLTAGYLSFNYVESDSNVIKLISAMPISDEVGKKSNKKEDYFEFKISNNSKQSINYEILLEPLVKDLDGDYLKIYLTDDNNKPLNGFKDEVPVWKKFDNSSIQGGKNIYQGVLNGRKDITLRLRVWISEEYVVTDKAESFSFRINIRDIDLNR